jgi:hypothetical protein
VARWLLLESRSPSIDESGLETWAGGSTVDPAQSAAPGRRGAGSSVDTSEGGLLPVELALSSVMARLPLALPSAMFAERVLARSRAWVMRDGRLHGQGLGSWMGSWMGHWGARAAVALAAVQAGLLLAATTSVARPVLGALEPARAIGLAASGLARGLAWLVDVPRIGIGLARLGEGVAQSVAGSPAALAVLALCLLSSATGLYLLSTLIPMTPGRSQLAGARELHGS